MAIGYNGNVSWGIVPFGFSGSNLSGTFWERTQNYLKSANDPLRYQVQWMGSGVNELSAPSKDNCTG